MNQLFAAFYTKARSARFLKRYQETVGRIALLEASVKALDDGSLRARFQSLAATPLAKRVDEGFALVREASRRSLGLRQFDVQLIGGLALLDGRLSEMRTGEGKTLTIVAPAALLALEGKGVHVVTSNSYLARRDAEAMRPVYSLLGLSVDAIFEEQPTSEKQTAYQASVTYGVGHEFGFDYLRDNTARVADTRVQDGLFAAIVDEVDSILIDEARVPLILSATASDVSQDVQRCDAIVRQFVPGVDFTVDLRTNDAVLTDAGYAKAEATWVAQRILSTPGDLYKGSNAMLAHRLLSAVRAYALYKKDRDYVVASDEVTLVDAGTGRKMHGRRLEGGLQEALEAKEGVSIKRGSSTRATITYQNYFALYQHLSGLTGTAATDADEFSEIYGLETVVVPPNKPPRRVEAPDQVFLTKARKFAAVVEEVRVRHEKGQPVLVGTSSVRDAEVVSKLLSRGNLRHEVLTAKHVDREAHIIAEAGRLGAITVATNMAGRGTDILLGGTRPREPELDAAWPAERQAVEARGGLCVIGTERAGLRRVDNQLAGRCGRQGDPGEVVFFMSLEDDLLRPFGDSKSLAFVRRLVESAGGALSGSAVTRLVESAQRRAAEQGFDARRNLMKYDGVLSDQRAAVFDMRKELLEESNAARAYLASAARSAVTRWFAEHATPSDLPESWDASLLKKGLSERFGLQAPVLGWVHKDEFSFDQMASALEALVNDRVRTLPEEEGRSLQTVVLEVVDEMWERHLSIMGELSDAVSLKGNSGLNPLYQYHKDAFNLFHDFGVALQAELAERCLAPKATPKPRAHALTADARVAVELERRWVTRNEPCPCGSDKRFKLCHGQLH